MQPIKRGVGRIRHIQVIHINTVLKIILSYLSVTMVIGSVLFLTSCTLLGIRTYSSCEETELPVFLGEVWPESAEAMSVEVYNRKREARSMSNSGVGVIVIPYQIDSAENLSQEAITAHEYYAEKSVLYLDGNELSKESIDNFYVGTGQMLGEVREENGHLLNYYDAGPYYMTWLPPVSIGAHRADFSLTNKEGETLEFSWCFTITKN